MPCAPPCHSSAAQALIACDTQQLRVLGTAGLFVLLSSVCEHGSVNPQLVEEVQQGAGAGCAPGGQPADVGISSWAGRLMHCLVHDHEQLDSAEGMKDKR